MRAHILITDKQTFPVVRDNGFWGVGVKGIPNDFKKVIEENLKEPKKPYFAMIADILGTRKGDIVFLYERQVGFHGIYKIASTPFFDPSKIGSVDETYPIRIELECLNYFQKPVPEDLLFSTKEYESKCWVWFYRKIQGSRGIITVNPETAEVLIELLVKLNGNAINKPNSMKKYPSVKKQKIKIDLKDLHEDGKLLEDILRAWLIKNIDNPNHSGVREIFGPVEDICYFPSPALELFPFSDSLNYG
ncbi:MAG: hypothetical protein ABIL89_02090 [candidate division WOR-3 bacterium]